MDKFYVGERVVVVEALTEWEKHKCAFPVHGTVSHISQNYIGVMYDFVTGSILSVDQSRVIAEKDYLDEADGDFYDFPTSKDITIPGITPETIDLDAYNTFMKNL